MEEGRSRCREKSFTFVDADGRLRKFRWKELAERGEGVFARIGDEWKQVRHSGELDGVGTVRVCIAPLGAGKDRLEKLCYEVDGDLLSGGGRERLEAMVRLAADVDPFVALSSNRFNQLGHEDQAVVRLLIAERAVSGKEVCAVDVLGKRALLREKHTVLQLHVAPGVEFAQAASAALGRPVYSPELDELYARFKSADDVELAIVRYLGGYDEALGREFVLRAHALRSTGFVARQDALSIAAIKGLSDPTKGDDDRVLHELLVSYAARSGGLSVDLAQQIADVWRTSSVDAAREYGTAADYVCVALGVSRADGVLLAGVLGQDPNDAVTSELQGMLAKVDAETFKAVRVWAEREISNGHPSADAAWRLCATFGDRAGEWLERTTAFDEQRARERASAAAYAATMSSLERDDPTYAPDKLERMAEGLKKGVQALEGRKRAVEEELAGLMVVPQPTLEQDARLAELRRQVDRLDAEIAGKSLKAKGASRLAALQSPEGGFGEVLALAAGSELRQQLEDAVRAYTNAAVQTVEGQSFSFSLADGSKRSFSFTETTHWLPADPDTSREFGDWLLDGGRFENTVCRPDGTLRPEELSAFAVAGSSWAQIPSSQRKGSLREVCDAAAVAMGQLEGEDAFSKAVRDMALGHRTAVTALELIRQSYQVPSPFDLTREFRSGEFVGRFIPRSDPRGVNLGRVSNCCQHLDGAGRDCAIAGQSNAGMGFFVVEDAKGQVAYQSWVWTDGQGGVCFDNIEGHGLNQGDARRVYESAADALLERFSTVTVGASGNDINLGDLASAVTPLSPGGVGYSGYRDSNRQLLWKQGGSPKLPVTSDGRSVTFAVGQGSFTVEGDVVTFSDASVEWEALQVLETMGRREWTLRRPNGTVGSLVVGSDPRLDPKAAVAAFPEHVYMLPPAAREKLRAHQPEMDDAAAAAWYAATVGDVDLACAALDNGWTSADVSMLQRAGRISSGVQSAIKSGGPDREVNRLAQQSGVDVAVVERLVHSDSLVRDVFKQHPSDPQLRAAVLGSAEPVAVSSLLASVSERERPSVLAAADTIRLLGAGEDSFRVKGMVESGGFFGSPAAERYLALGPSERGAVHDIRGRLGRDSTSVAVALELYEAGVGRADAAGFAVNVDDVAKARQSMVSYREGVGANQGAMTSHEARTVVEYLKKRGDAGRFGEVQGRVLGASPAELATLPSVDFNVIDEVCDTARVARQNGYGMAARYYDQATVRALADASVLSRVAGVASRFNDASGTGFESFSSAAEFAALASAPDDPVTLDLLRGRGVSAGDLARAMAGGALCEDVERFASCPVLQGQQLTAVSARLSHLFSKPGADVLASFSSLQYDGSETDDVQLAAATLLSSLWDENPEAVKRAAGSYAGLRSVATAALLELRPDGYEKFGGFQPLRAGVELDAFVM